MLSTAKHVIETADAINWLQNEVCPVTKRTIGKETAAIGYRIRNTEANRKKYGERVIEHRDNWIVVRGRGAAETVSRSWDGRTERIKALVESIKAKLKVEKKKIRGDVKPVAISAEGKFLYAYSPNGVLEG